MFRTYEYWDIKIIWVIKAIKIILNYSFFSELKKET